MNSLQKVVFTVLLFIYYSSSSFGQLRYILKLFQVKDEKYIALIEKSSERERQIMTTKEGENTYKEYESLLKKQQKEKFDLPGVYKSTYEFLHSESTSSLEETLKRKVSQYLAKGADGKLDQRVVEENNFHGPLGKKKFSKPETISLKDVSEVQVLISIPKTREEFYNIFKEKNEHQFKNTNRIREILEKAPNPKVHFLQTNKELTDEILLSPENSTFVLIGHNENGAFCFPDGSSGRFELIDSITNVAKRTIIYLSCNSNLFTDNTATNFYLTYNDGIALTYRINYAIAMTKNQEGRSENMKQILNNVIQTYLKEKKQKVQYKIAASAIAISGVGYTLYEIRQGNGK